MLADIGGKCSSEAIIRYLYLLRGKPRQVSAITLR